MELLAATAMTIRPSTYTKWCCSVYTVTYDPVMKHAEQGVCITRNAEYVK